MSDDEDTLFLMLNSKSMSKIDPDYLRMAVGFLDTDKLMEVGAYKTFVALVSLTKGKIQHQREFEIPVRDVMKEIGISTNNYDALREYVKTLMEIVLDFNTHRVDRNPGWDMAQILGPSTLKEGIIRFEFTKPVWEKLKDPIIYAYITRKGVYSFKSKYEIALYNWFTRLLVPNHDNVICEESITFLLKEVLHIDEKAQKTYTSYMRLNDKILKKSIEYINNHTNIHVKHEGVRESRTVTRVRFFITRQTALVPDNRPELPRTVASQLKKLAKLGLSVDTKVEARVLALSLDVGEEACRQRLEAIAKDVKARPDSFTNPGGYIRTKLFENLPQPIEPELQAEQPDFVSRYLVFFEQAFKALRSEWELEQFKAFLMVHADQILPRLPEHFARDKAFGALTKGAPLTLESLLRSRSLLLLVFKEAAEFGYAHPALDLKLWMVQHQDSLAAKARELYQQDTALRYAIADVKGKLQDIEQQAYLSFVTQLKN